MEMIRAFNLLTILSRFFENYIKGSKYQIYNIGTNKETNIKNLAFMIAKYLKVKLKINFVKGHIGGTKEDVQIYLKYKS